MQALEELVARWRNNPDPEATQALCAHLGTFPEAQLMREVGNAAEAWHRDNHMVMLSVGLMFLDAGLLSDAQAAMVHAAKLDPDGGEAYRYLGEVLLRRGDATRGEQVLARAIALGSDDPDTRLWHERAVVYRSLEKRRGAEAVAAEIARTAPREAPIDTPPAMRASASLRPPRARGEVRRSRPPPAAARPATARRSWPPGTARGRVGSRPQHTLPLADASPPFIPRGPSGSPRSPASPPEAPAALELLAPDDRSTLDDGQLARSSLGSLARSLQPLPPGLSPLALALEPLEQEPLGVPLPRATTDDSLELEPDVILASLAQVGLFEAKGGVTPAWEATPRKQPKRSWVLAGAIAATLGVAFGGYRYAAARQDERAAQARGLEVQLGSLLGSGRAQDLTATEALFQRLFELDSRGQTAAKLWLLDRVERVLLSDEPAQGLESAIQRARTVGVPEAALVFGNLASALAEADLPNAARLIERWDGDEHAKSEPYYQLLAGVVFERAGDERALERYGLAASRGSSQLAHVMAARLASLELEPSAAKPTLDAAQAALGDDPATRALSRLAWAAAGAAGAAPAPLGDVEKARLPLPLRSVDLAVDAIVASAAGKHDEAATGFEHAIKLADSPALATWIGYRALESGYTAVARGAALAAAQLSVVYPKALALATRVALADGRFAEAERLANNLGPMAQEPMWIRSASAYENLQADALAKQVAGLPSGSEASATVSALMRAPAVLSGRPGIKKGELERWVSERQIWGTFIALDAALDTGNLKFADATISSRRWDTAQAPAALRITRLARYKGELERALTTMPPLLEAAAGNLRYLCEAVLLLVDAGRADDAVPVLQKSAAGAGELGAWLNALVDAGRGNGKAAAQRIAKIDLPGGDAPLETQVIALRALAKTGDRRAKLYLASLQARFPRHPDVQLAARP
jgi:tetratricopeptide (TPR) repeat protein